MNKYLVLVLTILLVVRCADEPRPQSEIDEEIIVAYLEKNDILAERHSSGVYYVITEPGTGGSPQYTSKVEVKYRGYMTDGHIFDKTDTDKSAAFYLYNLIKGWQISIPMLQKGGSGTFYIPSELGYGARAVGSIPANSVLIFDIELINFQ